MPLLDVPDRIAVRVHMHANEVGTMDQHNRVLEHRDDGDPRGKDRVRTLKQSLALAPVDLGLRNSHQGIDAPAAIAGDVLTSRAAIDLIVVARVAGLNPEKLGDVEVTGAERVAPVTERPRSDPDADRLQPRACDLLAGRPRVMSD